MVKFILMILCLHQFEASANLFDFGSDKARASKIPDLVEKLKNLEMKDEPSYEDAFNQSVKAIENGVEEEKLFCSGESTDSEGKTLPPQQKQLCMRELKKHYLEAMKVIYESKRKYLGLIYKKQITKLDEIQKKLSADIEKNF